MEAAVLLKNVARMPLPYLAAKLPFESSIMHLSIGTASPHPPRLENVEGGGGVEAFCSMNGLEVARFHVKCCKRPGSELAGDLTDLLVRRATGLR